ncbi:MAG: YqhA family protein, partial [Nanoarchaeota archaeon]
VVSLLVSSLIAFYLGLHSTYEAFMGVLHSQETGVLSANIIVVYLISSIDEFLLGIILIIIALGIYELFISKIDTLKGEDIPYPNWLTFHSLDDLKAVLTKVIIIILMVYFFKSAVVLHFDTPLSLLYLSIGIVLIAVANYLSHKHKSFEDKGEKGH